MKSWGLLLASEVMTCREGRRPYPHPSSPASPTSAPWSNNRKLEGHDAEWESRRSGGWITIGLTVFARDIILREVNEDGAADAAGGKRA